MSATPTTRDRHALRWVLCVGLVFVVVVGMGLQAAQRRADERWADVMSHCEEKGMGVSDYRMFHVPGIHKSFSETRGGNIFREWRQGQWVRSTIVLRQERSLFGSSLEVHMSGGMPWQVDVVRDTFAGVDVEVVVEPPAPLPLRAVKQE